MPPFQKVVGAKVLKQLFLAVRRRDDLGDIGTALDLALCDLEHLLGRAVLKHVRGHQHLAAARVDLADQLLLARDRSRVARELEGVCAEGVARDVEQAGARIEQHEELGVQLLPAAVLLAAAVVGDVGGLALHGAQDAAEGLGRTLGVRHRLDLKAKGIGTVCEPVLDRGKRLGEACGARDHCRQDRAACVKK